MFDRVRFTVWTYGWRGWRELEPRDKHLGVLTPDISDDREHAMRLFAEAGYDHRLGEDKMRPGIPRLIWTGKSTKNEIEHFLSGLNKPWGTWDYRSIRSFYFTAEDIHTPVYDLHLAIINKAMERRFWLADKMGIRW